MKRILLLCFIHGFKGTDNTFKEFPYHLRKAVADTLPDDHVESVLYPQYETKGELAASTEAFLAWLKERVMELRKSQVERPWPPNDRHVGVVLIAHSMGGFVASDALFRILDDGHADPSSPSPPFPLIQGLLCFDTPYNGLARSMFVYGAFSNYQKVSNVFNVMTALSAAAPASLARLAGTSTTGSATATAKRAGRAVTRGLGSTTGGRGANQAAWKAWSLLAARTGTVGAIAAGGVAAYMHRREIAAGVRRARASMTREAVVQGYQTGVDALGQGLAYVNRGSVGQSLAWLADHVTFVGALLKQAELEARLRRLGALRGVGVRDVFVSLGENGVWSGGYFVPERTFCAVPAQEQPGAALWHRWVMEGAGDELDAHVSMFKPDRNTAYERMTDEAAALVVRWFRDETEVSDDARFAGRITGDKTDSDAVAAAVERAGAGQGGPDVLLADGMSDGEHDELPDESPIDITAAASLMPPPEDGEGGDDDDPEDTAHADEAGKAAAAAAAADPKQAYLRHLFGIAQQTGTNLRSYMPSKMPAVDGLSMPKVSMPSVSMPSMPSLPSLSLPNVRLFGKKAGVAEEEEEEEKEEEKEEGGEQIVAPVRESIEGDGP
ncbi:hypothetical protein P8C59_002783 [Phyllachora maydis]|uniref:DUF676 domain-containing protein n=1 Tax=Phyllachora maydis TaxID=1825666 RepID=A0AAD9I0A5_9PEZI|nr:hypothetical protein P8C59_002783 [Phyllachora maydis]